MMVTLFRFDVLPESEDDFRAAWESATLALREYGSHGSALFRDGDGAFHAIARWPDAATRDRAFAANFAAAAFEEMKRCVGKETERTDLFEERNLWIDHTA